MQHPVHILRTSTVTVKIIDWKNDIYVNVKKDVA